MDARFRAAWEAIERVPPGRGRASAIRKASSRGLIAALSAGAARDPALANAIATELLNRQQRAPFFGAFVASAAFAAAIVIEDFIDTGTLFIFESGPHEVFMETLTLATSGLSLLAFLLWRGRLPAVRRAFQMWRHRPF